MPATDHEEAAITSQLCGRAKQSLWQAWEIFSYSHRSIHKIKELTNKSLYQASIWPKSLLSEQNMSQPEDIGWTKIGNN